MQLRSADPCIRPRLTARARSPSTSILGALSRYRMKNARGLRLAYFHATATAARHMFIADALKARCVLADVIWRWKLKVLYVAAWVERNLCADPTVLNPCIFLSLRRVG